MRALEQTHRELSVESIYSINKGGSRKNFHNSKLHTHEGIAQSYGVWRKALKIPWREYFKKNKRNACYLINKEEPGNVKESKETSFINVFLTEPLVPQTLSK